MSIQRRGKRFVREWQRWERRDHGSDSAEHGRHLVSLGRAAIRSVSPRVEIRNSTSKSTSGRT